MNQRDATVCVIEFFRERSEGIQALAENQGLRSAIKVLEKRAEVLRLRLERRSIAIPADLEAEELIADRVAIFADLRGFICAGCGRAKRSRASFCNRCYARLDGGLRKALWTTELYPQAFSRAVRFLKS